MNKPQLCYYIVLAGAILLIIGFALNTYVESHRDEPYYVTYSVSSTSLVPCNLCIVYQDSTGLVTLYTDSSTWSKEICLPPNSFAYLGVFPIYNKSACQVDMEELTNLYLDDLSNDAVYGIHVKITSGDFRIWDFGRNFAVTSCFPPSVR